MAVYNLTRQELDVFLTGHGGTPSQPEAQDFLNSLTSNPGGDDIEIVTGPTAVVSTPPTQVLIRSSAAPVT